MQIWNSLHAARWKRRTQKGHKNWPSAHHLGYIFAAKACIDNQKKKPVTQQYLLQCPHNMLNFGPLTAKTDWQVWGTQHISKGFASWLHYCSVIAERKEVHQTLQNVWPSAGLIYYIYIFGGSFPLTEFCQMQNSFCVQVMRSPVLAALLHGTLYVLCGLQEGVWLYLSW